MGDGEGQLGHREEILHVRYTAASMDDGDIQREREKKKYCS